MTHLTVNGRIGLERTVYWSRTTGSRTAVDGYLGIRGSRVSPGARELCCRAAMGASFRQASSNLGRLAQIRMGAEQVRQVSEAEGRAVKAARRAGRLTPGWTAADCAVRPGGPTRLVVGCDGVKVPVVTAAEKAKRRRRRRRVRVRHRRGRGQGRRRRRRHPGADGPWKEFKLAAFYDASGTHQYAVGTAGDHEVLGRLLRREAGRLRITEADEAVSVTDGAAWIGRQLATRLPMLDARILDWYHLAEQVAAAAKVCFGEGNEAAGRWRREALGAVRAEGPGALLAGVYRTRRRLRSWAKREALRRLAGYVAKRAAMLDYPAFLQAGFDIGSGPTEAFCKTLTSRLKGSGRRWDRPNADAMMALASVQHSDLWETYWNSQRPNVG